eukprot:TRINITY_DN16096_c0_g1_i1.p1 TRINITY_DN16096_c0_g1~~TRINITY_DN16096_c0_g1_i1.p1  ORF type:complete len:1248 (+),score=444.38 TRINITY_DN16096_c0_g1_i1:155-3898(+)
MATLKLQVFAARDLPAMGWKSGLADAYVEIKHGELTKRTPTKRKTLNPTWDFECTFDIADYSGLQECPLEMKVWDHSKGIAADNAIGNVVIDLNMVLLNGGQPQLAAWFPIFDSMRGLRGELFISLQIKFMHGGKHANPFIPFIPECKDGQILEKVALAHPSIAADAESVLIFATSRLDPNIYRIVQVVGMVEELSLRHDPEHARLQSLRSSRQVNEQRMLQFFKASGHVRRMLAQKAKEYGCNCIIGYKESYDLEPSVGNFIIRAAGTCCQVAHMVKDTLKDKKEPVSPGGSIEDEDQPSPFASWPHNSRSKRHQRNLNQAIKEAARLLTMKSLPCHVIKRIGGVVSARSIKLITALKSKAVVQERDSWWQEIREEVKINARAFCCNAVVGYTETTMYIDDVVILSGTGTAVMADWRAFNLSTARQLVRQYHKEADAKNSRKRRHTKRHHHGEACNLLHVPITDASKLTARDADDIVKCLWCKNKPVPAFLLANMEIPAELPIDGTPQLIETRYVQPKADASGETLATSISKTVPKLEYHVHRQLVHKVQSLGLNAAFGLRVEITIGSAYAIATATATGVYVPCLPTVRNPHSEEQIKTFSKNSVLKLSYFPKSPRLSDNPEVTSPGAKQQSDSDTDTSSSSSSSSSGSCSTSESEDDTLAEIFSVGSESGHIKPYVIELDETEGGDRLVVDDGMMLMNVDNVGASTVNMRPAYSISLQRRYEFKAHGDPNPRLNAVFKHLHKILRSKLRTAPTDGILASYRSELIFASDNDINIRLFGFLLEPHRNREWFNKSLNEVLVDMEARRNARRELKQCGRVHGLRFILAGCKDSSEETSNSLTLEIRYGPNDGDVLKLAAKQATVGEAIMFQLKQALTVLEYRIKCTDGESGKDPAEWSLFGSISSNPSKGKTLLLSQVEGFEMPAERGAWCDPLPCDQPYTHGARKRDGQSPNAAPEDVKKKAKSFKNLLRAEKEKLGTSPGQGTLRESPRSSRSPKRRLLGPSKDEAASSSLDPLPVQDGAVDPAAASFHIDPESEHSQPVALKKYKPYRYEVPYLQASSPFSFSAGRASLPDATDAGHLAQLSGGIGRDVTGAFERYETSMTSAAMQAANYQDRPDSHHVIISPMDTVPGCTIKKYLGFLSHHFLRESEKVQVHGTAREYSNGLGNFYSSQVLESNHIIRRLVHSVDGNALLSCSITQHSMLDSDASRNAYHFYTVSGQIAEVQTGPVGGTSESYSPCSETRPVRF